MRRKAINILITALFLISAGPSYCGAFSVDELIGQYSKATTLQRPQVESLYKYKAMDVIGTIKNVESWNAFDERTDTRGLYYKVTTNPQKTNDGSVYELQIFYKDRAGVEKLEKGQEIKMSGTFIKIIDELNMFSVWIYADELNAEDKFMLNL